ncbi:hypothetical protein D3C77_586800 [compost metagenome]
MGFGNFERSLEFIARVVQLDFFRLTAVQILREQHGVHIFVQLGGLQLLAVARQIRSDLHLIAALMASRRNRLHLQLQVVVEDKINIDFILVCPLHS